MPERLTALFSLLATLILATLILAPAASANAQAPTSPGPGAAPGPPEIAPPDRGGTAGDTAFWSLLGSRLEGELGRIDPAATGAQALAGAGGDPARALARRVDLVRAARRTRRAAAADASSLTDASSATGASSATRRQLPVSPVDAALDRLAHALRWTARRGAGGDRPQRFEGRLWLAVDELGRRLDREAAAAESRVVTAPLAGTGTIAGTVTDDVTGAPVTAVSLNIRDEAGSHLYVQGNSASGAYSVSNLPAGTYYAWAVSNTHVKEIYDDVACLPTCHVEDGTPIAVSAGSTTSGIDFALHRGGSITGTVTEDGTGDPLSGVAVIVSDASFGTYTITTTLADGTYTAGGLPTGSYYARTYNQTHADELYDDVPCTSQCDTADGTPIAVTVGVTTPGIDFALAHGGSVAGTIADAVTGLPLAGVHVNVRDTSGNTIADGVSGSDGAYVVTGVPTATVYALAYDETYVDELYDDVPCFAFCDVSTGTPISVTAPLTTAGINFRLSLGVLRGNADRRDDYRWHSNVDPRTGTPVVVTADARTEGIDFALDRAASISGTVTDTAPATRCSWTTSMRTTRTAPSPTRATRRATAAMRSPDCPPAPTSPAPTPTPISRRSSTTSPTGSSADITAGTPISVYAGATTPDIDFALEIGGTIRGSVVDATTLAPLADVFVRIDDGSGALATLAKSGSGGSFVSSPLRSGTYYARIYGSTTHYGELYSELPYSSDPTTGSPISVVDAAETAGIDFTLDPKVAGCTAPQDLDLSAQTIDSTVIFTACHSIRAGSGFTVAEGGDVTLRAGGPIVLYDGFSVVSGGRLTVEPDASFP